MDATLGRVFGNIMGITVVFLLLVQGYDVSVAAAVAIIIMLLTYIEAKLCEIHNTIKDTQWYV